MRTLALIFAFILTPFFNQAQTEVKGQTVTVTINNVKNNNGKVIMLLHTSETFMKSDAIQTETSTIEGNAVTITFKNVPSGEYAIMGIHDENENNKMDFNETGMPKESYGMSNNPMAYGPPQYNDAKFKVENETVNINIRF